MKETETLSYRCVFTSTVFLEIFWILQIYSDSVLYTMESAGEVLDLDLSTWLTTPTQVYVAGTNDAPETDGHFAQYTGSHVFISGIWWGLKKDKQLDITRVLDNGNVHSHYYFVNAGQYEFDHHGFADRIYANRNIRLIFDGPASLTKVVPVPVPAITPMFFTVTGLPEVTIFHALEVSSQCVLPLEISPGYPSTPFTVTE